MSWLISLLIASGVFTADTTPVPTAPLQAPAIEQTAPAPTALGDETERIEKSFPLSSNGRVSVSNINGSINIETWDKNEVSIVAVKTADTKERLNDAEIRIDSKPDSIVIKTLYENSKGVWSKTGRVTVEYRLTVPRGAVIDGIDAVNGSITITNAANVTKARTVNGEIRATNLRGDVDLSTVNGTVAADFDEIAGKNRLKLATVNGVVTVTLPSDSNATLKADTLNGSITNDFGLPVRKGEYVGRDLYGKLGNGEASVRLNSLNGTLTIKRKSDGRTPSPVVDLLPEKKASDDREDPESLSRIDAEIMEANREAAAAMEEARRELERVRPEIERAAELAALESVAAIEKIKDLPSPVSLAKVRAESERLRRTMRDRYRNLKYSNNPPVVDVKTGELEVKDVPTVKVEGGEAEISVRGWDKKTIRYTVTRISGTKIPNPVEVRAERSGNDVTIEIANPDCDECPGANPEYRIEVMVPKRSNLRINSEGEIRLENVIGDIEVEGGDEAVNMREIDGNLKISNTDGRVRVIGFRGDATATTVDGEISIEGDVRSLNATAGNGEVLVTLPESGGATVISSTRSIEADGFSSNMSQADGNYTFKVGAGGGTYHFNSDDGRLRIRSAATLRSSN